MDEVERAQTRLQSLEREKVIASLYSWYYHNNLQILDSVFCYFLALL